LTLENANSTLSSLGTLLESNGGNVGEILDNLRETSASLRDFANDIKSNPSLLIRSNDPDRLPETR
jgi:ABC-type transporter Mla subunit MlaD